MQKFFCFWVAMFWVALVPAMAQQMDFSKTIAVVVDGDYRLRPEVQGLIQAELQKRGFAAIILPYRQNLPYRFLEIKIERRYDSASRTNFRLGNWSLYSVAHRETISVLATFFQYGNYGALPLSTGTATRVVVWQERFGSFLSGNTSGSNSDEIFRQAAREAVAEALNQIFPPPRQN